MFSWTHCSWWMSTPSLLSGTTHSSPTIPSRSGWTGPELLTISTGAPQGCISSPVLFTLYTNEYTCGTANNYVIEFSDDTAILGVMYDTSDTAVYEHEIQNFVHWCNKHFLILSIMKTKKMETTHQNIAQVDSYRYLGIHIDNNLTWRAQVENVCTTVQQWLHFLRRLSVFGVNQKVLLLFCHAVVESILRCGISAWFGNLSVQLKAQTTQQEPWKSWESGSIPHSRLSLMKLSSDRPRRLLQTPPMSSTLSTSFFPQADAQWRLNHFKSSFVPLSIKALNDKLARAYPL